MKRFQFLLLDAGPIIKLFELGIWEAFIEKFGVTICRRVAEEAKWASRELEDIRIDLDFYEQRDLINIEDVDLSLVQNFYDKLKHEYVDSIHDGEKETLSFLYSVSEDWRLCAADGAVFRVLGLHDRAEQGISLEEVLIQIGLSRQLEWQYTEKFREKYTRMGQIDSIQDHSV
jgi:hypothetical protein